MRSEIAASWLGEAGLNLPRIRGGHKFLRQHVLRSLEHIPHEFNWTVLSGPTGSGKTRQLEESEAATLDLEKIACHKGSTFGGMFSEQPTQASFENQLAVDLIPTKS